MTKRFYIRANGKVHGPVDANQLKQLAAAGKLKKDHELSQDNETWRLARKYKLPFPQHDLPDPVPAPPPIHSVTAGDPTASQKFNWPSFPYKETIDDKRTRTRYEVVVDSPESAKLHVRKTSAFGHVSGIKQEIDLAEFRFLTHERGESLASYFPRFCLATLLVLSGVGVLIIFLLGIQVARKTPSVTLFQKSDGRVGMQHLFFSSNLLLERFVHVVRRAPTIEVPTAATETTLLKQAFHPNPTTADPTTAENDLGGKLTGRGTWADRVFGIVKAVSGAVLFLTGIALAVQLGPGGISLFIVLMIGVGAWMGIDGTRRCFSQSRKQLVQDERRERQKKRQTRGVNNSQTGVSGRSCVARTSKHTLRHNRS